MDGVRILLRLFAWASGYIWLLSDVGVCSLIVWVWGYGCCDSVLVALLVGLFCCLWAMLVVISGFVIGCILAWRVV